MGTRKLIVKISYGLVAALVIVLISLLVYQQRSIQQMTQNEVQTQPAVAISDSNNIPPNPVALAEGGRGRLAAEVDELRYQLEASEQELEMARNDMANARGGWDEEELQFMIERRKKMMENPSVRNNQRIMAGGAIDRDYGAFFERLGLPDEKLQDLKTLLVDMEVQSMEAAIELEDRSLTKEEGKEKRQLLEDQKTEYEKQISNLLGAETYKKYDDYKGSATERWLLSEFPISADGGLSDEKEQMLVSAMYEERRKVEAEYGIDPPDRPRTGIGVMVDSEGNVDTEDMERQLEIYDRYLESARGVLSESQAEQFENIINGMQESVAMAGGGQ